MCLILKMDTRLTSSKIIIIIIITRSFFMFMSPQFCRLSVHIITMQCDQSSNRAPYFLLTLLWTVRNSES